MKSVPTPRRVHDAAVGAFHAALRADSPEDLYEHAPCGYLSTLPDGTIAKVNETFLAMTGYRRDQLVGQRRLSDLLAVGGRIYWETHVSPLLRMQDGVRAIALEVVAADRTRIPVLVNAVLLRSEEGEPVVVRAALFDATDRRAYEQALLDARTLAEKAAQHARELAETLQASLIPPSPPEIPGLDVAAAFRPAGRGDEVGGDFYDVFETTGGAWAVVIGDVCGKGATAAAVTALARYTVRAAAMGGDPPSAVLGTLNTALVRAGLDRFVTSAFLRVDREDDKPCVAVSTGGHPLPLLRHPDGRTEEVGREGRLLGVFAEPLLHDTFVELEPGEALVLFTDGVTEARRGGELFGEARLRELVAGYDGPDAAGLVQRILDEVMELQQGFPADDIAIVVVRVP